MPRRANSIRRSAKARATQHAPASSEVIIPAHGWTARPYQRPLWEYMTSPGPNKLACATWHRRAGKDLLAVNLIAYLSTQRPGLYWHVFPLLNQGRRVVWEGYTKEGRRFLDYLPGEIRQDANQHEMRLNLATGSTYQIVGGDNADKLVGANPVGVVFTEYALMDPAIWHFIQPILAENDGWALFISTPRGRNHYFDLYQAAASNPDWFAQTLTVEDTKAVSPAQIEQRRKAGMPENLILQEFYCSWNAPISGSFYGDAMQKAAESGRIRDIPYDPALPVNTAWDIGVRDTTVILFYQTAHDGIRIIDCHHESGEGIAHYASVLRSKPWSDNYGTHTAPWDIAVREIGSGKTRLETAYNHGILFRICPRHEVSEGIEAVRNTLPEIWFHATKCSRLIEALKTYRKEWDEAKQVFKASPTHDWASHFADALRYLVWNHNPPDHKLLSMLGDSSQPDAWDILPHHRPNRSIPEHGRIFASFRN